MEKTPTTPLTELTGFRVELPATINFTIWAKDWQSAARLIPAAIGCFDNIDVDKNVLGFSLSEAKLYADPVTAVDDYDVADEYQPEEDDEQIKDDTIFWKTQYFATHRNKRTDITEAVTQNTFLRPQIDAIIDAKGYVIGELTAMFGTDIMIIREIVENDAAT